MRETSGGYSHPSTFSELTSQPHFPVGSVLLANRPLFVPMGLRDPIAQRLGTGSFGAAYEVPLRGRSVLKLTRDPTEVQAATLLLGRNSQRIVHVWGVWAMKGTFGDGLRGWYAVHRDYLTPLSKRDRMLVEAIFSIYEDTDLDLTLPRTNKQHAMVAKWRGYLREELMSRDAVPVDDEGMRMSALGGGQLHKRAMMLLMDIGAAVDEMHRAGIDWEDIHSGNMMRNPAGRMVISDIGWGTMHDDFSREVPFLTVDAASEYARLCVGEARQASSSP